MLLLSLQFAGGDQGAAHTMAPRAAAFLAFCHCDRLAPVLSIPWRRMLRPMPLFTSKNRSAWASVSAPIHTSAAPKPSIFWRGLFNAMTVSFGPAEPLPLPLPELPPLAETQPLPGLPPLAVTPPLPGIPPLALTPPLALMPPLALTPPLPGLPPVAPPCPVAPPEALPPLPPEPTAPPDPTVAPPLPGGVVVPPF